MSWADCAGAVYRRTGQCTPIFAQYLERVDQSRFELLIIIAGERVFISLFFCFIQMRCAADNLDRTIGCSHHVVKSLIYTRRIFPYPLLDYQCRFHNELVV